MPILTKPTITKGTPATFTLDKSLLAALPSVANDTYFSNQSNWSKIVLSFKSATGSQNEVVVFDATLATPTGTFLISLRARDAFNIIKIDIYDFDNGGISIPRSALNAAEFDIDMTPTALTSFSRDFLAPALQLDFEFGATPFGTIQYAVSGLRLIQTGFNPNNYQIYYTSPLSSYFPNIPQNYTATVSYEVISIDAAFLFLKVLLGDGTIEMNYGDPRLSLGVHTDEVFTFNACNVLAGGNSFQFYMNAQNNTEIKFFSYVIQTV